MDHFAGGDPIEQWLESFHNSQYDHKKPAVDMQRFHEVKKRLVNTDWDAYMAHLERQERRPQHEQPPRYYHIQHPSQWRVPQPAAYRQPQPAAYRQPQPAARPLSLPSQWRAPQAAAYRQPQVADRPLSMPLQYRPSVRYIYQAAARL